MASLQVPQLYRQLLRAGSRALRPERRLFLAYRDQLRQAFADPVPLETLADALHRGQTTLQFIQLAETPNSLEHKTFHNLCYMRLEIQRFERRRSRSNNIKRATERAQLVEAYDEYHRVLQRMNQTLGTAFR
ncbi:hypothetical protein H4R34_000061 [Dimargaris verticillata]|uniref:Complex 1 LYR protein n=1 Tax=Dimargaris verticillata TaxID=2761393 RepID=A0A9W8EC93_9FUNG|nr:hypothetical protein H4R34_000061 [Dimargaris verticillata]